MCKASAKGVQSKRKKTSGINCERRKRHPCHCVLTCNAMGSFIPPALIMPCKKFNPELYDDAPPLTLKLHNESGYMTGRAFKSSIATAISQSSDLLVAQHHLRQFLSQQLRAVVQNNTISPSESLASSSEPTPSTSTNLSRRSLSSLNDVLEGIRSIPVVDPNTQ
ncbi:hypothetical protein U1Q18_051905 [Sarracenia purpurea var. burkii]